MHKNHTLPCVANLIIDYATSVYDKDFWGIVFCSGNLGKQNLANVFDTLCKVCTEAADTLN